MSMNQSSTFLDIRGVSRSFASTTGGAPTLALQATDLAVAENDFITILGPSGCGKSTLLRCINGLETISDGEIRLNNDRITGPGVDVNALRRESGKQVRGHG